MNPLPVCYLCTPDQTLSRKIQGYLHGVSEVRHLGLEDSLVAQLEQFDPAFLILDLRAASAMRTIEEIHGCGLRTLVLGLAPSRSDPALKAETMDLFALDTPEITHDRLLSLVLAGRRHVNLIEENAMLKRTESAGPAPVPARDSAPQETRLGFRLMDLVSALRRFDRPDAMLDNIVEWIANCALLSRAGIFALSRNGEVYRFRAGLRHLPGTVDLEFGRDAPLVRWMQMHAHIVSHASADCERDRATQRMLLHALNAHGAEVLAPLHGRRGVIGWLFAGRHVTGRAFSQGDLEELTLLTELVSIATENSLLHEDVTLQKTLAETVIHSIPVGIVATGEDGTVEWFNPAAEENLNVPRKDAMGQRIEKLGSRLADLLHGCLANGDHDTSAEWTQNANRRTLSVTVRRLTHAGCCLGAMGIIRDLTPERQLMEQRTQQDRMVYWSEMISAISHEVRNPLVAVNTFAQLLPERYDDPAFREEFAELATREIRRLNGLLDQLQSFANPRELTRENTELPGILAAAIEQAEAHVRRTSVKAELRDSGGVPPVHGDRAALTDAFAKVIVNALEAAPESSTVLVSLGADDGEKGTSRRVAVRVSDQGPGIPESLLESVFSPFCTTKTRGIGLGLPVARRVAIEHGGTVDIQTGAKGTTVTFLLPVAGAAGERKANETCACR
jgi:two-component system nitrogen regulation sensor histidine kinase GlnL